MSTSVKCRGCGANYKASGSGDRCPVCDKPYQEPKETADKPKAKAKKSAAAAEPLKCPVCKKTLPAGIKFCAACGTNVGTADAGDAFVAGAKLEEKSQRDIAKARWQMFFFRFFRWW